MKATSRHKLSIADVLPHMTPGQPHALLELAKLCGMSRGLMNILLDNGVNGQKIVKLYAPKDGRDGAQDRRIVYYIAGTEPRRPDRIYAEGAAMPITVCAATAVGTIDAYAKSLRDRVALAMSIRGHHYVRPGGAT